MRQSSTIKGVLYGTTAIGGSACSGNGCGTVFAIAPSGAESVLYSFKGYPVDGDYPDAALLDVNGVLYGTTYGGGANDDGTVFPLSP